MILKDALSRIGQCLAGLSAQRFTGQIVFTLHMRQGGIAKALVRHEAELAPDANGMDSAGEVR